MPLKKVYLDSHVAYLGVTAPTALTDSTGGAVGATLAAVPGTYSQTQLANALATLNAQVAALTAAMKTTGLLS